MMRPGLAPAAALLLAASCAGLAACATPLRPDPAAPVSASTYDGGLVLAVIGTPLYALAKATTCVATVLVAAPSSVGVALTDRPDKEYQRMDLQAGVAQNCGGPYWLYPVY